MDKRLKIVEHEMEDRISNLPSHLIDMILVRMPFKDIVRTSILAKTWRKMWATFPRLVLDKQFYDDIKNKDIFPSIIVGILSHHVGSIRAFTLHIPKLSGSDMSVVDNWMLMLSEKALLGDLRLDNSCNNERYKLPDSIFSCSGLKFLQLNNCLLEPPHGFGGFCNLALLSLINVSFSSANVFEKLLPSARMLRGLAFLNCSSMVHVRVDAPHLHLLIVSGHEFDFELSGTFPKLKAAYISCRKFSNPDNWAKNSDKLLCKVWELKVIGCNLQFFVPGNPPLSLRTPLMSLIDLDIKGFEFNNLNQMCAALCIIKSSPNLTNLYIQSAKEVEAAGENEVIRYLEKQENVNEQGLRELRIVKLSITDVGGVEMFLTKLLLAKASALETMTIEFLENIEGEETSRAMNEIRDCRRASSSAVVNFLFPEDNS